MRVSDIWRALGTFGALHALSSCQVNVNVYLTANNVAVAKCTSNMTRTRSTDHFRQVLVSILCGVFVSFDTHSV